MLTSGAATPVVELDLNDLSYYFYDLTTPEAFHTLLTKCLRDAVRKAVRIPVDIRIFDAL